MVEYRYICGIPLMRFSTSFMMLLVSESVLPGAAVTETNSVPVSSSGINPVLVVLTSTASKIQFTASATPTSHLRRKKNFTPILYLLTKRPKAVSKAMWKRDEKLIFLPSSACMWGVMMSAQSAGQVVRAFNADIPTATAIVKPNCV